MDDFLDRIFAKCDYCKREINLYRQLDKNFLQQSTTSCSKQSKSLTQICMVSSHNVTILRWFVSEEGKDECDIPKCDWQKQQVMV